MRPTRLTRLAYGLALSAILIATGASTAGADSAQVIVTSSTGVTDNAIAAADGTEETTVDWFLEVRPGVTLTRERRLSMHRFGYTFGGNWVFADTGANSYSNRVEYNYANTLTPRSELRLNFDGTHAHSTQINTFQDPSGTVIGAVPAGPTTSLNVGGQEIASKAFSAQLRGLQMLQARLYHPLDDMPSQPQSWQIDNTLGMERNWERDILGADLKTGFVLFRRLTDTGTGAPETEQINVALSSTWMRDLGRNFTSQLEGGAGVVTRADGSSWELFPVAMAAIRYSVDMEAAVELAVMHHAEANLVIGQTFVVDQVNLRGGMFLGRDAKWVTSASAGAQRAHTLALGTAAMETELDFLLFDAAVSYRVSGNLNFSLRYQHVTQTNNSATGMDDVAAGFTRNMLLFSVAVIYPSPEGGGRAAFSRAGGGGYRQDRVDSGSATDPPPTDPR